MVENLDKFGYKKVREGAWWQVLSNYKTSGMKITLTLKDNPKGRKRKPENMVCSGVVDHLHWDDMDEYVIIRDEKNKTNRFMIEDLYSLKPFGHGEGENNESE